MRSCCASHREISPARFNNVLTYREFYFGMVFAEAYGKQVASALALMGNE
jgi:hypothetical protein